MSSSAPGTKFGCWVSAVLLGVIVTTAPCLAQNAPRSTDPRSNTALSMAGAATVSPLGPSSKRIEYLYTFSHPRDLGWKKSIWRKVLDWVEDGGDRSVLVRPYALAVDSAGRIIATDLGS